MAQLLARATFAVLLAAGAAPVAAQDVKPVPTAVWAPKPRQLTPYTAPQRPWITLAEVKKAHAGEPNWRALLVDDGRLMAEYVSAAPGTTVGRRFHPDTREWFAVVEGEVRVDIEGQAPFTATRGSLVNIPRQTLYSVETVGASPSLRFVVNVTHAKTVFTSDAAPPAPPEGSEWVPATINRTPGRYDEFNKPHLNIHEEAAKNEKYAGGRFVRDDKSEMLVLYGHEKNMPPLDPADKGHFHEESAEFWLVFTGKIRYAFEGQEPFVASEGDVVYVPAGTWHATRYTGPDPSCRLSITEYVGNTVVLPRQTP